MIKKTTRIYVWIFLSFFSVSRGYSQSPYTDSDLPRTKSIKNKNDQAYQTTIIAFLTPFVNVESKGYGPSSDLEDSLLSIKTSQVLANISDEYLSRKLDLENIKLKKDEFSIINKEVTKILKHFFEKKQSSYYIGDTLNTVLKTFGRQYVLIEDLEWLYNTKQFQKNEEVIHFTNFNREIRHYGVVGTESKFSFFLINVETKEVVYYKFDYWWKEQSFLPDASTLKPHFIEAAWLFYNKLPKRKS